MNTNPKTKFNFILIFLVILFLIHFCSPSTINNVAGKVRESKIKVAEINRDISLLDKISHENSQYANDIQKVVNTLPSKYFQVSFFSAELERIAQNNSLTLTINIDKEKKEETETISSIEYALEVTGSYASISNFLSQMSKLPYHTSLEHTEISKKESEPMAKITFKLFVQK